MKSTLDNEIPQEVFELAQRRARVRGEIRNKVFFNNPQDKILDYLVNLQMRIEDLEWKTK